MGLINRNAREYYQSSDLGDYQFTSLSNIINQFEIAYVGEGKIIPKVNKLDIAFHAQRALQELSFDTLKAVKSQEIVLPPSLTMILPQDYVNYTKVSWVDSSGIKHPLHKTNSTSNPFSILQNTDGSYNFVADNITGLLTNGNFDGVNNVSSGNNGDGNWAISNTFSPVLDTQTGVFNKKLQFVHGGQLFGGASGEIGSRTYAAYQKINISNTQSLTLQATAKVAAAISGFTSASGTLRIGITTLEPDVNIDMATRPDKPGLLQSKENIYNLNILNTTEPSFAEFTSTTDTTKTIEIDVSSVNSNTSNIREVYVFIYSEVDSYAVATTASSPLTDASVNIIDDIIVTIDGEVDYLQQNEESTAFKNYKSNTPSENNQDDYEDDIYWPMHGNRYGLDPQHAQANGSFYIDNRLGKINFSSNISGKTVILDYISDSLGTDAEMQVHKFAEEAMYKCIAYAILSTTVYGQQLVPRFKKEKFAEVRKAKLRLSGLKIEELTQILRGKSKQIKH